jgi:hypothetical protein
MDSEFLNLDLFANLDMKLKMTAAAITPTPEMNHLLGT